MMTKEDNELLTRVGPGTPAGEFLRRYWQPVALIEELPVGGSPKPVRLLGEDLVLFRDDRGRPGLLGIHCAHRGVDLSYGRLEDGGLRCIYHGWLFDVHGRCLEQPGEPEGGKNRDAIRQRAYPCREFGGFILTYMGPGDAPEIPNYESLAAPDDHRFIRKYFQECSYLQGNEGNIDPVHLSFLHAQFDESWWAERDRHLPISGSNATSMTMYKMDRVPTLEVEITDYGVRIFTSRNVNPEQKYLRVSNFIMPNLCAVPGPMGPDGYNMNWHVPVDDTHHWKYMVTFRRNKPLDREAMRKSADADITPDYRLIRNMSNRYQQDRDEMKDKTYSGLAAAFVVHDALATETQGAIQDRTQENPASSDIAILAARKLLFKGIRDVQQGKQAPNVTRDPTANQYPHLRVISKMIPGSAQPRSYFHAELEAGQQTKNNASAG
jgi:phenylpropionate dioxygenase-like ring-hydroxylating dioxygenase large terminal subunit